MLVADAIAEILKREGVEHLSCYPTTPLTESSAAAGIRPIICRQERVGVGIADGFARVSNGRPPAVFAMQYGPGAENAYPGVATAYSDSTPMLLLPLGHARMSDRVFPLFSAPKAYESLTKSVEQISVPERTVDAMRRAFAAMKIGRPGPVLVELPQDVAGQEIAPELVEAYRPIEPVRAGADARDIDAAAKALLAARRPIVIAGAGVLYAEATAELAALAELLQLPVMTTMEGKSAISEAHHPLALGSGSGVMSGPVYQTLRDADLVLAVGTSLTRHAMVTPIPAGKTIIHATNDPVDLHKSYAADHAILGDAKLVLAGLADCCRDLLGGKRHREDEDVAGEIARIREAWLAEWTAKLASDEVPINPYRVISDLMRTVPPGDAIVTHDAGNPRYEIMPFYRSDTPRSYLGWGKSHQLGTGLGLVIGAKLAAPDKFCVNFMGDAAFGMTGLDFETAVRADLPICTIVLKNATMAVETDHMALSHERYNTRDVGGDYADIAQALGGWSERVEDPAEVAPAIGRARRATEDGQAALLEFITSEELAKSHHRPFG
ncbi:MAG: thiamine pyrophosphate-requiring protein [Alphaproteobacteria bacterium]|jgi:thiamine pyrophosphate-dependent acetolactate synthase large subunit-like protein|nr:thiamine pyrophosphate-requiring protein [Alphaproteobacteria bacterium]